MIVNIQIEISDEQREVLKRYETGKAGLATREDVRSKVHALFGAFMQEAHHEIAQALAGKEAERAHRLNLAHRRNARRAPLVAPANPGTESPFTMGGEDDV